MNSIDEFYRFHYQRGLDMGIRCFSDRDRGDSWKSQGHYMKSDEVNTNHRGYGRSFFVGGLGGMLGRYSGKRAANEAIDEGFDDDIVKSKATKKGALVGALGAVGAGVPAYAMNPELMALAIPTRAVMGAIGGGWGAHKNASEAVNQRNLLEYRAAKLRERREDEERDRRDHKHGRSRW